MGATVTVGKSSAAFVRPDGTIIYALFEKTYEKNCYPHMPRWSCIAFGTYDGVMKRVFGHASACEGGMLQSTGARWILPENYIAAWQRAIKESVRLDDTQITLKKSSSYRGPITVEKMEATRVALAKIGHVMMAIDLMCDRQVVVSLHDDTDLLLALYGEDGIYPPWMILDHAEWRTIAEPAFAPVPRCEGIAPPNVAVYRHQTGYGVDQVISNLDGQWRAMGAPYSAVQHYINDVAFDLEMKRTGCAKDLIAAFREQCSVATPLPMDTRVAIHRIKDDVLPWYVEKFDSVAKAIGLFIEGGQPPEMLECTLGEIVEKKADYDFFHLDQSQVEWCIPQHAIAIQRPAIQLELAVA